MNRVGTADAKHFILSEVKMKIIQFLLNNFAESQKS